MTRITTFYRTVWLAYYKSAVTGIASGMDIGLPLAGILDFAAEKARLEKEIKAGEGEVKKIASKLANEGFLAKAPKAVVQENRRRLEEEQACINPWRVEA